MDNIEPIDLGDGAEAFEEFIADRQNRIFERLSIGIEEGTTAIKIFADTCSA